MLLAAGAAAGMAATFGSPVSAVLLAIELLLFEFRPRSLIPVGLASVTATGVRIAFEGTQPVFAMSDIGQPSGAALAIYILLGAAIGVAAVYVTRAVYAIEDAFARLPIHWMWWPAIGAVAVGVTGYFVPRTLGVGYDNIADVLSNTLALPLVAILCVAKFISWSIALGSGTSGGTLAPLFTIGGSLGALLGAALQRAIPAAGVDPRIAALVGMAAIFAGASRAMLTSVVFAFETTRQPLGLLPLLGGCTASYLISCLLMRHSIMTEKIARRGVRVPAEYSADVLEQVLVAEVANPSVVTLRADAILERVRTWIASGAHGSGHQGFPVLDETGVLIGVVTRRDLLPSTGDQSEAARPLPDQAVRTLLRRPPVIVYADCSLREAVDHMVKHDVGRLPVVARETRALVGIITRSDVLSAHRRRLEEGRRDAPDIRLSRPNIDATQQRPA
jgi:CBS domain-containing protein